MPKAPSKSSKPFETQDAQAALAHFAPVVEVMAEETIEICNADPDIAGINARRGVDAIRPHLEHVQKALPLLPVHELLEIPALTLALGFAAARVFVPASPQEIRARQESLRPARKLTLLQLEILAALNIVPEGPVKAIRANRGPLDEAKDGIAIVALFREHAAAVKGKHPFDDAYLQTLADDGNWLYRQLEPLGTKTPKGERNPDAILRDRLWTELNRRYDDVYKAGVEIWGRRKVDEHIPSLHARVVMSKESPAKPDAKPDNARQAD